MSKYKFKNRKFPKEFKKVSNFIKQRKGVDVKLDSDTRFNGHFTREILIHHNYDLKQRGLYMLLHECGKVYQSPELDEMTEYQRFCREMESWDIGLELAKEIGIELNEQEYRIEHYNSLIEFFKSK